MAENSTLNLIVKYIYKETDLFETLELEYAIENNKPLRNEYVKLLKSVNMLNVNPSTSVIDNILQYSKSNLMQKV